MEKFDFSGWATIHNVRCTDGRTITEEAFKHCDGKKVPLVWNHQHNDPTNVLGHAFLEYHDEGIKTFGFFNDTLKGQETKLALEHGDIVALSIYANNLQEIGPINARDVIHGDIKEVSLVLAGANPKAFIDMVMSHSDDSDSASAVIYTGEPLSLYHSDDHPNDDDDKDKENKCATNDTPATSNDETEEKPEEKKPSVEEPTSNPKPEEKGDGEKKEDPATISHSDDNDKPKEGETLGDVLATLNDKQKTAVYGIIGGALPNNDDEPLNEDETKNNLSHKEDNTMKNNVFDQNGVVHGTQENTLSHSEFEAIMSDTKRYGSAKESALAHGIENIEYLFPDAKNVTNTPIFIDRDTSWVNKVMSGVHHTPYSRIKSIFADITADEARALGYMKGNLKKEEVFTLLKRTTSPTTVYKKQKFDRDDLIDITELDILGWIKTEMRGKLDEELARAYLIGDGRLPDSDDKIKEDCIRPIWTDDNKLFTINSLVESDGTDDGRAKEFIKSAIKSRKDYKGSGNPVLFTTEDMLTDMLLLTDNNGRDIYEDEAKLCKKLRVKEIITVPVMEGAKRTVDAKSRNLLGIIVNLNDYNVGADKGGAVNMFDDFDIDYNAQKYLIETRCSGALIKPFSAIVLEETVAAG